MLFASAAPLSLSSSCANEWVVVAPFVRCGGECEPDINLQCGEFGYQYNHIGRCVCAEDAHCANYPCELPPESKCFVAGYNAEGECVCVAKLEPGTCGQPCSPVGVLSACKAQKYEYNEHGDCDCAPAMCPCGQVCPGDPKTSCLLLRQYNAEGECDCAPVICPTCEGTPCCSALCGSDCIIPGCDEDGSHNCEGFCNKTNECVKGSQLCNEVP